MTTIKLFKSDVRDFLLSFLDENTPRTVFFLHRLWKEQENAITYKDLREALLSGEINTEWFRQWQQDYSNFVTEHLEPDWRKAIQEAARQQKKNFPGWRFDPASEGVNRWTSQRGAAFVTNCTDIQRDALQAVISRIANTDQNVDALAKLVRPMIGLTRPQSVANANYVQTLREKHVPPKRVADLAMKYAARQHRYRAQMIARTELAFAFNQGTLEWARQAQAEGYLGKAVKVWISARDERCCDVCRKLNDDKKEIPLDEPFPFKTRLSDPDVRLAPPAHPHCRCAIDIKEIEPPRFDYIEEIEAPKPLPDSGRYDIIEEMPENIIIDDNEHNIQFMSAQSNNWSETEPIPHTDEELAELAQYAKERGIKLYRRQPFNGDIALIKAEIDIIAQIRSDFSHMDVIQLGWKPMSDDDLGETSKNHQQIWINEKALRNQNITENNLLSDNWFATGKVEGIAAHEMGHILSGKIKNKKTGLQIYKETVYNITGKELTDDEALLLLLTNVSEYATVSVTKLNGATVYDEIISEMLSIHYTMPNKYSAEFVRLLKGACKK